MYEWLWLLVEHCFISRTWASRPSYLADDLRGASPLGLTSLILFLHPLFCFSRIQPTDASCRDGEDQCYKSVVLKYCQQVLLLFTFRFFVFRVIARFSATEAAMLLIIFTYVGEKKVSECCFQSFEFFFVQKYNGFINYLFRFLLLGFCCLFTALEHEPTWKQL